MEKVMTAIKKFFIWLGAVSVSVITFLAFYKSKTDTSIRNQPEIREDDKIETMAESKRKEAVDFIRNSSASDITAGHKAVRGAIDRGIGRFRERCSKCEKSSDN